jgi:MFS family permease
VRRRRGALAALCLTEIVSYGVLYYAFPVLAGDISAAAGWSRIAVTAAFSAASLAAALSGVAVGRLIDRYGPRPVMTAGSVLAVIAVAAIAGAPAYGWFLAAWLLAGVAMAGVFYPPAFAALTAWYGADRVRALTTLTLAAGFASTIFAPLTSALSGHLGWRGTYLVLAAILAAVTIPAHALALRLPWAGRPGRRLRPAGGAGLREVLASRTFLLLAGAMTLLAFGLYAVVVNLVPLLTGRGLAPSTAAWALGLGGLGQVAGRLCYQALCARAGVTGGRGPGHGAAGRAAGAGGGADRGRGAGRGGPRPVHPAAGDRGQRPLGSGRVRLAERRVRRAADRGHRPGADGRRGHRQRARRLPRPVRRPGRLLRGQRRPGGGRPPPASHRVGSSRPRPWPGARWSGAGPARPRPGIMTYGRLTAGSLVATSRKQGRRARRTL